MIDEITLIIHFAIIADVNPFQFSHLLIAPTSKQVLNFNNAFMLKTNINSPAKNAIRSNQLTNISLTLQNFFSISSRSLAKPILIFASPVTRKTNGENLVCKEKFLLVINRFPVDLRLDSAIFTQLFICANAIRERERERERASSCERNRSCSRQKFSI